MRFVASVILLLLFGCSATGPLFSPVEETGSDEGVLYVYRPADSQNSAIKPEIWVNGHRLARLLNGGYTFVRLEEGMAIVEMTISGWEGRARIGAPIRSGAATYVRLATNLAPTSSPRTMERSFAIREAPSAQGRPEIAETRLVAPEWDGN